jgi:hypothetical protein
MRGSLCPLRSSPPFKEVPCICKEILPSCKVEFFLSPHFLLAVFFEISVSKIGNNLSLVSSIESSSIPKVLSEFLDWLRIVRALPILA